MVINLTKDYFELESQLDMDFEKNPTFRQALSNFGSIYYARLLTLDSMDRGRVECDMPRMRNNYFSNLFKGAKNSLRSLIRK